MQQQNKENIKQFFEGWKLYSTVIEHNYMLHNEVIAFLHERLSSLGKKDMRILEVGCGDAHAVSHIAKQINISHYTGIELSEMALQYAKQNLDGLVEKVQLINGDMLEKVTDANEQYDAIIAGYSMHHLSSQQKGQLFAAFKQRMHPDGVLIIYDLVQQEDETAKQYIERALGNFETYWTELTPDQLDGIKEHVSNNDIPESWQSWKTLAQQNGYSNQHLAFRDEHNIYGVMEFSS